MEGVLSKKYTFSGHESFPCRFLWLKKGYDFIKSGESFRSNDAALKLGVGKNMVVSIKYWLDAFGLTDEKNTGKDFAQFLFDEKDGKDPYLEYIGSLWLLHIKLIMESKASIYSIFFNDFLLTRVEFTKEQLVSFLKTKAIENDQNVADNTLSKDINVLIKTYVPSGSTSKTYEDDLMSLFFELNLIKEMESFDKGSEKYYNIEKRDYRAIPKEIFLSTILLNKNYGKIISFNELLHSFNSPGNIFLLTSQGLLDKIKELQENYDFIEYKEDAGVRVLQITRDVSFLNILEGYYE